MPVITLPTDGQVPYGNTLRTAITTINDAVDDTIDVTEIYSYRWTDAAARAAETGMRAGDIGYQVDNETYYRYNGSAWRVWARMASTYTPTITNGTRLSGDLVYAVSSGIITVTGIVTLSAVSGDLTFSAPPSLPLSETDISVIGVCGLEDVGTTIFTGVCAPASSTTIRLLGQLASGTYTNIQFLSGTIPFTWVSGDRISVSVQYRTTA